MLGLWGVDGIRGNFLGETNPRSFGSGLRGGVVTRTSLETFCGFTDFGELAYVLVKGF